MWRGASLTAALIVPADLSEKVMAGGAGSS